MSNVPSNNGSSSSGSSGNGALVRAFSDCIKCQQGEFEQSYRLCVKRTVESRSILFHVHNDDDFYSILGRLCELYPDVWKMDVVYYFYVDMGGFYHTVESPFWLKDKDTLVVTEVDDLDDLPKINLAAAHASFRSNVSLRPHQVEGVNNMLYMEKAYRGGILADEMGLGKTVQTIAVIMYQQPVLTTHACTLIVVPSRGIADQWAEEIRTKTTYGSIPYFQYRDDSAALLEQPCFRVVITTYDRVRAEYKKNFSSQATTFDEAPLFDVEWHRVVLDESHKVRGGTMLFQSVNALKAKYRWCLSGTPFQNDVTELYPIFTFLKIDMDIKKRREHDYMMELLKTHMIRRTKVSLHQELRILPRQEKRIVLEFTKPERALYDYLERLLYHQLTRFRENNDGNSLLTSSAILYLRLKQVCGHHMILLEKFPDLIPMASAGNDKSVSSNLGNAEVSRERNYYDETSEFEQALEIIESYYDQFGNLQEPIDISQLQKLKFMKHSTKVKWLVGLLQQLTSADPTDKIVVVSQFVDVILKVGEVLGNTNLQFQIYHGGMSIYSRKLALQKFNHDPKIRVLIMSLKAGGVGLNLQRANHMVIMDRWWNPATMDQAIARIHRMTQLKETYIHTVVIKDTIEESLMDNILNKKNELFQKIVERHEQKGDKLRDVRLIEGAEDRLPSLATNNKNGSDRNNEPPVQVVKNDSDKEEEKEEEEEEEEDEDMALLRYQEAELKRDQKIKENIERMNKEVDATLRDIDTTTKDILHYRDEAMDEVIAEYTYEDLNLEEPELEHVDVIQDYNIDKENIIEKEEHFIKKEATHIKEEQVYRLLQDIEQQQASVNSKSSSSKSKRPLKNKRRLADMDKSNIIVEKRTRA